MAKRRAKTPAKRGPKAEVLKLDGDWRDVIKRMISVKPRPAKKRPAKRRKRA